MIFFFVRERVENDGSIFDIANKERFYVEKYFFLILSPFSKIQTTTTTAIYCNTN